MKTKRLSSGLIVSILAASASSLVQAATFTSVATGDWGNSLSWDVGVGFPNTYASDSAIISATHSISYDGSMTNVAGLLPNLVIANGNSITVDGGALTQTWVPGAPPLFGTTIAIGLTKTGGTGTGTLNINNGGAFTSGTANTVVVGVTVTDLGTNAGDGTVNINQGTMTLSGAASGSLGGLGLAVGINAGATGTINVGDGGGVADSSLLDLATNNVTLTVGGTQGGGAGAGTGTVRVKSDGRLNTGTARATVGDTTGATGTLSVEGGTLAIGAGGLTVGNNGGTGNLNVSSGLATIDGPGGAESFQIGAGVGSTGNVNVTGGTLNSVNNMLIGVNGGVGTVTQTGGAVSFGGWMAIGFGAGAAGSSYNISGGSLTGNGGAPLEIGADRAGSMSISGTATVNVDKIAVGIRNNSNGTLDISGGTTTTKFLAVAGDQGGATHTGVVNITGGVNTIAAGAGQSYVGRQAGSTGTLNLNGGALTNASGQDFHIGFEGGTGNLNITNGGSLTHNWWVNVARSAGSSGQITVSGAGSTLTQSAGQTNIGEDGSGALTVSAGGVVNTADEMWVGRNGGSSGTVLVEGAGSAINFANHLFVGGAGSGSLTQTGGSLNLNGRRVQIAESGGAAVGVVNLTGGTLNNSEWFHVGSGAGANGTVNVNYTIPTDTLTTGAFYVGNNGATGTLNIVSGVVTANNVAEIGRGGGTGNYNQSGGSLAVGGLFALGIGGTGIGSISGGTTSSGGDFRVGDGGGTGTLNISGTASITANGEFQVGNGLGNGTVNMTGGNILANSWVAIGRDGGSGVFNLSGGTFTKGAGNGTFDIGTFGNGATPASGILNQTGGAIINTVSTTNIARDNSGSGVWNMFGGTATLAQLSVGNEGVGTLTMDGVGTNLTAAGESYVGNGGGGRGTLTIRNGAEAHFNGGWSSKIGNNTGSVGTMNLESGGKYLTNNSWTVIASEPGSTGVVNISDDTNAGTLLDNSGAEGRLIVGRFGNATVNQSGGSVKTGNWFVIGLDPGSTGTYNFSGGNIDTSGNYDIGKSGTGVMNITHGNAAGTTLTAGGGGTPNQINVGTEGGSRGTLSIDLANSTDRIKSRELFTGNGAGTVGLINISKGILQTNEWVEIGRNGGTGTLNVSGADSKWERGTVTGSRQDVQVGYNGGNGTINVANGGTVNHNWWFNLARGAGSTGTMTIDGAGSTVNVLSSGDNNAQTNIGENGIGTMTITNGGVFNHMMAVGVGGANVGGGEVHIAREGGSVGSLTVSGPGSAFNSKSREFRVGNNGSGTLNILDGGVVNYTSTNEGGANVDGNFGVGHGVGASGTINMDNGTLNVSAWALFGAWDGVASTANINMVNSTINILNHTGGAGHLFWGDTGTATINQEGGAINVAGWSAIGRERGGDAFYNLGVGGGGGSFTVGDSMHIGRQSHGTVNIGTGATFVVTANDLHVGMEGSPTTPSSGVINNNGGLVQVAREFNLGRNGGNLVTGTYSQTAGQLIVNGEVFVGRDSAQGTLNLSGGTAQLNNNLAIGQGGGGSNGTVNITNATMNVNGWLTMGRDTGGAATTATLNIGEGGVYNHPVGINGDALIGWQPGTTANVNITNGGQMNYAWWFRVGVDNGATGNITIDGAGSKLRQDSAGGARIMIGESGIGNLTVSNGGVFEVVNSDQFQVGGNTDANGDTGRGTLNIDGAGSLVTTNNYFRAGVGSTGGGRAEGAVNITNGGKLSMGQWGGVGHEGGKGTLNMDSGNLEVGTDWHVGIDTNGRPQGPIGLMSVNGNSTVSIGSNFFIGRNGGTGTVSLNSGTVNVRNFVRVGEGVGGVGTLNIVGTEAVMNAFTAGDDFFRVGVGGGNGTVNILDGGRLNTNVGWFTVGENDGSVGNATVSGAGSTLTANGLIVGWNGNTTGTLNIADNAVVNSTGREVSIGRDANPNNQGFVNISSGGTLNGREFRIGHNAKGTVSANGGTINSQGGWFIVADGGTSTGALNLIDSALNVNDSVFIGNNAGAVGTLTQSGNTVTKIAGELNLGRAGGNGTLNIAGGTFRNNGWTTMGRDGGSGTGTMNVTDGGKYLHPDGGDFLLGWTTGSTGNVNVSTGGVVEYAGIVRMAVDGGSFGNVNIEGAGSVFRQNSGSRIIVGESGTGVISVSNDGTLVAGGAGLVLGGHPDEADTGTGTLSVAGGHVRSGGEINAGFDGGSTGNINVTGGTVEGNSWFIVGRAGTGLYNQTDGRVWNTNQELRIGNDGGGSGTMNVLGGSFNSYSHGMVGESGTGVLNVTGGIVGIGCCTGGDLFIGHLNGSSGTVNVTGGLLDIGNSVEFNTQGGATVSTLNLNGGILAANFINDPTGSTTGRLNADGGTLKAKRNEADFIRGMTPAQLVLNGAGLTIDTNNFTVTSNAIFSGTGGLTKGGFGQLNITNNQINTGNTGVTSGVLNLDFTAAGAPTNLVANAGLVLGGGTLRVNTGAVANTQNFTGTTINSGSSRIEIAENVGAGTINLGAITRNAGGTVDVGTVGTVSTTSANVNGILGKGVTVNGNDWAKNDGADKIVAAVAADYAATFGAANNLDVTAPITGGGAVNSIKATANITLDANTTVASGGILIPSTAGNVIIASTAGETLTSGNNLDLVVIQNSAAGVATIASKITGVGIGLTKSGVGTLVLGNAANDYTGGTFINSGALIIGADSALGDVNGGLTLAAPSLASGGVLAVTETMTLAPTRTVTLNSGGGGFSVPATKTLTINQDISGAGGLAKVGAGTLVLGGVNTYTGDTAIFEGSLTMNGSITSAGGFIADGNVTLGTGGSISTAGAIEIARNAGPAVSVTGVDATISGGEFTIGGAGNASVTLTGASTLAASCDLFVARLNGSTSSLTVTGGAVIGQKNVIIGAAGGATGTASVTDGTFTAGGALIVGNGGGTGTMNLAGTTVGSYGYLEVGNGGTGTLNISGTATLKGSTAGNSGYINIGANGGTGTINQTGGEVSHNSWVAIGLGGGSNDPTSAQYNLSGGTLASSAGIEVGTDHGGSMNVSGTGALAVSSISIGHRSNGNGVLNISGGTVTTNEITVAHNADNAGGTAVGVMNVSGGVTQINGALIVARNSGGGSSNGTVNFGGGEIKLNTITRGAGASAQLNFNGTVIKPNATNGNFITGFDTSSVDVKAGGAIFNTDGKNIGISTSLDGVGALTKAGNGKLQLSGDSSYAGGVNLDAGTISVRHNNALGAGTLVGNGGILSFDNASGNGLIEGRLAGGFNTTDAIPFDSVQLGTPKAQTTNAAEFGDNTTWGYRGNLIVPAGGATWSFAEQFDDSVLLKIDGNILLNDGTWNNPTQATVTLAAGPHTFELRVGQGGGGVGPNNGWGIGFGRDVTGAGTLNAANYAAMLDPGNGSLFTYDDGGNADYTVANAATLNVDTQIHVFQYGATMTGDITGVGGINKTGNGRLTLAGTNSYAGTTNIAAGVLEIGNGGATGSLGAGAVTNAGTLKFNRTGTLNVPNTISGAGALEHNGAGTTILAGTNTYTGATTVNGGELRVNGSISGSITTVNLNGTLSGTGTVGPVIVNGGTLAPGASPGILNSGNVTFNGGALSIELNGTTVGTLYDQLNVTGSVTLQSNTALAINFGYGQQIGDSFTIINNDGLDTIGGGGLFTFAGTPLADGDLFSDFGNNTSLMIDYTGGTDDNDVVLSVVPEPGAVTMLLGGIGLLLGGQRLRRRK